MLSKIFSSGGNKETRFIGIIRESPPLHFYLIQSVGFLYLFYRFSSRNFTVYGFLAEESFNYPRLSASQFVPVPILHFTTFQFIYAFLRRPSPEVILVLQWVIIVACCLGLLGLFPKWNALISFLLGSHLTGMMQSSNANIDGGSLVLCLMLILALSPSKSFYGLKNGFSLAKRSVDYHWPVALLFIMVGAYYTFCGLDKLIAIGPHWPLELHLENLASRGIEDSLFLSSRYRNPFIASWHLSYTWSVISGILTFVGELGFISILFLPRYRLFFIVTMIGMHFLVFMLQGINFAGNSVLLLLCLDWNVIVRKATVYYDSKCGFCLKTMIWLRRLDWFGRLAYVPIAQLEAEENKLDVPLLRRALGVEDENGEIYYGADAVEQIASRCPVLFPFALLMKIPVAIYLARYVYGIIARNRIRYDCAPQGDVASRQLEY